MIWSQVSWLECWWWSCGEASCVGEVTKAPRAVATWDRAWEDFTPLLAFSPQIRKIIYTTNMIESINFQIRKVTKARGSFPTDEAAMKLI